MEMMQNPQGQTVLDPSASDPAAKLQLEKQQKRVKEARSSLLMVLILSVVNMAMLAGNVDSYFLCSISMPYETTLFLKAVENGFSMGRWVNGPATYTAMAVGFLILGVYLACWICSKKKTGWLTAAAVLFVVDTLYLVVFTFLVYEDPTVNLMDLIFHVLVLVELILGVVAAKKLRAQEPKEAGAAVLRTTDPEVF